MTEQIGAPVFIDGLFITESSFRLSEQPADAMSLDLDVEFDKGELLTSEDGLARREAVSLSVRASLISQGSPDDERMHAFVHAVGTVGVPSEVHFDSDSDVVSYLYKWCSLSVRAHQILHHDANGAVSNGCLYVASRPSTSRCKPCASILIWLGWQPLRISSCMGG